MHINHYAAAALALVLVQTWSRSVAAVLYQQLSWSNPTFVQVDDEGPVSYATCNATQAMVGVGCQGKMCDSMFMVCASFTLPSGAGVQWTVPNITLDVNGNPVANYVWQLSTPPYTAAPTGLVARGLAVKGAYTSFVGLFFGGAIPSGQQQYEMNVDTSAAADDIGMFVDQSSCGWGDSVTSDSRDEDLSFSMCPTNKVMVGISCAETSCGRVAPLCCPFSVAVPINNTYSPWSASGGGCNSNLNVDTDSNLACGANQGTMALQRICYEGNYGGSQCPYSTAPTTTTVSCDPCVYFNQSTAYASYLAYNTTVASNATFLTDQLEQCAITGWVASKGNQCQDNVGNSCGTGNGTIPSNPIFAGGDNCQSSLFMKQQTQSCILPAC